MENQLSSSAAQRRIKMIACHLQSAATDDHSSLPNLLSVNCSSTFSSGITRGDSRLYFARQGSSSQAFFMRQVSQEQDASLQPKVAVSVSPPAKGMTVTALNRLMYSRPETLEKKYPSAGEVQVPPVAQNGSLFGPDPPKFAKPTSIVHEQDQIHVEEICNKQSIGHRWSPKMDIVETQSNYVVAVEVPGTGVEDIRVEVNNQSLVVIGKRASQWWKISACSADSVTKYHTRGIQQGPYQVEWPLPADANKDTVSAQFVNGILQITIPKLQACCA